MEVRHVRIGNAGCVNERSSMRAAEGRRHRHSGSLEGAELDCKPVSKSYEENQKRLRGFAFKLLFVLLVGGASLTILLVPTEHLQPPRSGSSSARPPQNTSAAEERLLEVVLGSAELNLLREERDGKLGIGFVDFRGSPSWEHLAKTTAFEYEAAGDVGWSDLYPEWIDEEEQMNTPACPKLPMPTVPKGLKLDLVVSEVSCDRVARNWSRDVSRLQKFLAIAKVAADSGRQHMFVLIHDKCRPTPNLFTCRELVHRTSDGVWLYRLDLKKLRRKLSLPVGSCELAISVKDAVKLSEQRRSSKKARKEAYVTILHSAQFYVCGAITLAQSIRMTGSARDLVILVDATIQPHHREGLAAAGWKVREIERIRNPKAEPSAYNEWNYSKFRLWQLTEYEKLIFIDADVIVLRNMDFVFDLPEIAATGNHESMFNSGVMVVEPSSCSFEMLLEDINEVESYNGGDQGYLNEVYTWWHRLPKRMNFLKHFGINETDELNRRIRLFEAEPAELFGMHYLGIKPWLCFRDYDCNWNQRKLHEYANDGVHAKWWSIHDRMPKKLRKYCLLRSKQKASLEWDRRQAEAEGFEDGHWRRRIKDSRLKTCFEEFCYWESMLWHWGENSSAVL